MSTGLILGLRPDSERRRYFVTTSLIGCVQAEYHPCEYHDDDWKVIFYGKPNQNSWPSKTNATQRKCNWYQLTGIDLNYLFNLFSLALWHIEDRQMMMKQQ